jgi:hypothetical protein
VERRGCIVRRDVDPDDGGDEAAVTRFDAVAPPPKLRKANQ